MTFETYQIEALKTARYPLRGDNMVYPAMKLAGEAGEVADKIGKWWRNNSAVLIEAKTKKALFQTLVSDDEKIIVANCMDSFYLTKTQIESIILELGDCLWYVCATAKELGFDLNKVAELNLAKLADREERGTVLGEGDYR